MTESDAIGFHAAPDGGSESARVGRVGPMSASARAASVNEWLTNTGEGRRFWPGGQYGDLTVAHEDLRDPYAQVPWVYSCVRRWVEGISQATMTAFDGETPVADSHPIAKLLDKPNPDQSQLEFLERVAQGLGLAGECFLFLLDDQNEPVKIMGAGTGEPKIATPTRIVPVMGGPGIEAVTDNDTGRTTHWRVPVGGHGRTKDYPVEAVALIKLTNPTKPSRGIGPMGAAFGIAAQLWYAQRFVAQLLSGGGEIGGWVNAKSLTGKRPTPAEMRAFEDSIERQFDTSSRSGGTPVLWEAEYHPNAPKPRDMQFAETTQDGRFVIASVFGVPPALLGDQAENYATFRGFLRVFWTLTISPLLTLIADAITSHLFQRSRDPGVSRLYAGWDTSMVEALQGNLPENVEAAAAFQRMGVPLNRALQLAGIEVEDEIPGGDVPLITGTWARLEDVAEGAVPAPPQAPPPAPTAPSDQPDTPDDPDAEDPDDDGDRAAKGLEGRLLDLRSAGVPRGTLVAAIEGRWDEAFDWFEDLKPAKRRDVLMTLRRFEAIEGVSLAFLRQGVDSPTLPDWYRQQAREAIQRGMSCPVTDERPSPRSNPSRNEVDDGGSPAPADTPCGPMKPKAPRGRSVQRGADAGSLISDLLAAGMPRSLLRARSLDAAREWYDRAPESHEAVGAALVRHGIVEPSTDALGLVDNWPAVRASIRSALGCDRSDRAQRAAPATEAEDTIASRRARWRAIREPLEGYINGTTRRGRSAFYAMRVAQLEHLRAIAAGKAEGRSSTPHPLPRTAPLSKASASALIRAFEADSDEAERLGRPGPLDTPEPVRCDRADLEPPAERYWPRTERWVQAQGAKALGADLRALVDRAYMARAEISEAEIDQMIADLSEGEARWRAALEKGNLNAMASANAAIVAELSEAGAFFTDVQPDVIQSFREKAIEVAEGQHSLVARRLRTVFLRTMRDTVAVGTLQERVAAALSDLETEVRSEFAKHRARARTIARTELGQVSGIIRDQRMREAHAQGVTSGTGWLTAVPAEALPPYEEGGKVRHQHWLMDGRKRDTTAPWIMPDGSIMRHVRDPLGPAGQIINCVCEEEPILAETLAAQLGLGE